MSFVVSSFGTYEQNNSALIYDWTAEGAIIVITDPSYVVLFKSVTEFKFNLPAVESEAIFDRPIAQHIIA